MTLFDKIGAPCVPWKTAAPCPVHVLVCGLIYAPFVIYFLKGLRISLKGLCWSIDILMHLMTVPCQVLLTFLKLPLDMCDAYKKFSGKCPRRMRCKCAAAKSEESM